MKKNLLAASIAVALGGTPLLANTAMADDMSAATGDQSTQQILRELDQLKQRVERLQSDLDRERARNDELAEKQEEASEKASKAEELAEAAKPSIDVGGAVRFNYTVADNDDAGKDRGGDLNFDTFRLNFDGEIGGVILSAEWRWYEYMSVIHHAWVGYEFTDDLMARAGIFQVPFGVLPYNSHNFYFSSLYYAGLEDNYDFGIGTTYTPGDWRFDLALLKNDERGGSSTESYSANVVGYNYNDTDEIAADNGAKNTQAVNTLAARAEYDYQVNDKLTLKPGASLKYGQLDGDASGGDGDYYAAAAHLVADYDRWNVQLQYTDWEYDLDDPNAEFMNYGYYSGLYTGPLSAQAVTANVAYTLPVEWGPVSSLSFYNDYSLIFDKNADFEDTYMNVTGMAVSAGGIYAYFDVINGENQPFVANGMTSDGGQNTIFNINVGYYF